jgi:hypothetical protein
VVDWRYYGTLSSAGKLLACEDNDQDRLWLRFASLDTEAWAYVSTVRTFDVVMLSVIFKQLDKVRSQQIIFCRLGLVSSTTLHCFVASSSGFRIDQQL